MDSATESKPSNSCRRSCSSTSDSAAAVAVADGGGCGFACWPRWRTSARMASDACRPRTPVANAQRPSSDGVRAARRVDRPCIRPANRLRWLIRFRRDWKASRSGRQVCRPEAGEMSTTACRFYWCRILLLNDSALLYSRMSVFGPNKTSATDSVSLLTRLIHMLINAVI